MPARRRCACRAARSRNWWVESVETLWAGIHDSLFGFRVYPIAPLLRVMRHQPWMRRFDFDVEVAVRLCWRGLEPRNLPAPVRYFRPNEGGVSHFNYWRDNALLTWMHARLFTGFCAAAAVAGLVGGCRHRKALAPAAIPTYCAPISLNITVRRAWPSEAPAGLGETLSDHVGTSVATNRRRRTTDVLALEREIAQLIVQGLNLPMPPDADRPRSAALWRGARARLDRYPRDRADRLEAVRRPAARRQSGE